MHDHREHAGSQQAQNDEDRYDEEFWEDRYRSKSAIWSGRPNDVLVAEVSGLSPGTALDVGAGEGGDAIWLAQQGWTVTAVDFSTVALERGKLRAQDLGIDDRIHWVHADLTQWRPAQTYDLVSCQYLHLLGTEQQDLIPRLAGAVAVGGTLLYVSHDVDEQILQEHPHHAARFEPAERVADLLDPARWEVIAAGQRHRADAGEHPAGHVHDSVLRAVRRN
jgi:SAM-dependent methyltransferase